LKEDEVCKSLSQKLVIVESNNEQLYKKIQSLQKLDLSRIVRLTPSQDRCKKVAMLN